MQEYIQPAAAALLLAWLAHAGPASAVPPPPGQVTAECGTPTYASDVLVCADAALRDLDRRVGDLLPALETAAPPYLLEPQQDWFQRRSLCAFSSHHSACLHAAYADRIALLEALATAPPAAGGRVVEASCRNAPWGKAAVSLQLPDEGPATVVGAGGRLLAVASSVAPRDDWTPFLRVLVEGRRVRLLQADGTVITCRSR